MQREIKFRAWDKKDKVMREVYGIQFPKVSNHGNRNNTIIEMHCSDYENQKAIIFSDFTDEISRVWLMQFTGLKDKNGVEIYEGDIVLTEIKTFPFKVQYVFGYYEISANAVCRYSLGDFEMKTIEVIGNIYKNPELLSN